jgi:DNA-binding GntR family transcriptional regulator
VPLTVELDRSSPVPLYYQLAQAIEAAIRDGELAPGDRFENELALAKRLTLSRPTTRRAIQELVDKGLLVRKRGVGTQVVQNPVHRRVELTSLFDDLAPARNRRRSCWTTVWVRPTKRSRVNSTWPRTAKWCRSIGCGARTVNRSR